MKAWAYSHKKITRYRFRVPGIYLFDSVISLTKTSIHTVTADFRICYRNQNLFSITS